MEERLRESEQRYRNLVENSQGLICTHDMEGTLLSVNPAVAHLGGYQPSEMVGRNLREFLMPAVRPFFGDYLEGIRQEKIVSGILRGMTKDGRERVWAYRNVRLEEAGKPPYVLGHAIDITERVRAEEALRETEARLRTVIANSPIVLFALDREGVFTLSEGKVLDALGLKPGEVVGKSVFDVYAHVPQILKNCRRALNGESFTSIMEVTGLIFEVVYVPLQDRKGVVTSVIGVATDITEKNRLEMELLRAAQISLIGELAAGLAHEIKNPLAGIQGVIRVLMREPGCDEAERGLLEAVGHEVRRIDAIVDMLLDQARVRVRQVARESLNEVVNRAIALARNQAAACGAKIDIEFESALEPLVILIDAAQMQGAVLNLIINAIEAIDHEGRITVRVKRGGTGGAYPYGLAIIEVEDTGRGIPDDSLGRIFNAFFTTKPRGTGLGLPAVRRAAESHGGDVEVKSILGRGSIFTLSLSLSAQDLTNERENPRQKENPHRR